MSAFEYIIGAILIVFSLIIISVILLQQGRQSNMGVISGSTDSYLDKGAARTWDMRLAHYTKILAILFFVLVFAGMMITKFVGTEDSAADGSAATTTTTTTAATTTTTAASE